MKIALTLATISLLAFSMSAQATLQSGSWKISNDNQVTIDTSTGLEWLRLNNTKGQSINDVISKLGAGGAFAGWRLPTEAEVLTLTRKLYGNNIGQTAANISYDSGSVAAFKGDSRQVAVLNAYNMLGSTQHVRGYDQFGWNDSYWSYGMHLNENPGVGNQAHSVLLSGVYTFRSINSRDRFTGYTGLSHVYYTLNTRESNTGVFLVSDGGLTVSSKANPLINQNNLAAPNQLPRYQSSAVLTGPAAVDSARLSLSYSGTDYQGFNYRINGGAIQTTTSGFITLTGLTAETNYTVDYAAYNVNGQSVWQQTSFTTAATPVSGPASIATLGILSILMLRRKKK